MAQNNPEDMIGAPSPPDGNVEIYAPGSWLDGTRVTLTPRLLDRQEVGLPTTRPAYGTVETIWQPDGGPLFHTVVIRPAGRKTHDGRLVYEVVR